MKITIRRGLTVLLCLSFFVMIGIGLLMAGTLRAEANLAVC